MKRFFPSTGSKAVAASCSALMVPPVTTNAIRQYWDPSGHQPECLFMDRKDLEQLYPGKKPKVVGGEYGYQRMSNWCIYAAPNPAVRLPHERRRLNPKKAEVVTVIGATGFLGVNIVKELLSIPEIKLVRACTRYPTLLDPKSDLAKLLDEHGDRIELHECDVTDRIQVNVACNGADTIIHAVDFQSEYAENSHLDIYVTGGINVAWTARNVRAERVIFCSGLDATFQSESNYCDMRFRGEEAVAANFPDSTILRFGHLYGKGYRYRGLGRYIYPAPFHMTRVQPTWVTDAARMVTRCARSQRSVRYKFDLGGPTNYSHLNFMRNFARLYESRVVFPFPKGVAMFWGKFLNFTYPDPPFDDNWILTWELDQVNRSQVMFDRLGSWDRVGYVPHTMQEAADIDINGAPLKPMKELQDEWEKIEARDSDELKQAERESQKQGVFRGKAEPGYGRRGGMEALVQEIYPGEQFRIRSLPDAKYPDSVDEDHRYPVTPF